MRQVSSFAQGDIEREAAYWFMRLREEAPSDATQAAFDLWLDADPAHHDAYERVSKSWSGIDALREDDEISDLHRGIVSSFVMNGRPTRHWRVWGLVAASMLCVLTVAVAMLIYSPFSDDPVETPMQLAGEAVSSVPEGKSLDTVRTGIGERATHVLTDGSSVDLNTSTALRVTMTETQRTVILLEGQAIFDVAHDPTRPFVVYASDRRITALGTSFEVRVEPDDVEITLIEGRVKVAELVADDRQVTGLGASRPPEATLELLPGERVAGDLSKKERVDEEALARSLSWRSGRLEFQSEKLSYVVSEINRYSTTQVQLANDEMGLFRVTGSFAAGSTENFVLQLTAIYPVTDFPHPEEENVIMIDWRAE